MIGAKSHYTRNEVQEFSRQQKKSQVSRKVYVFVSVEKGNFEFELLRWVARLRTLPNCKLPADDRRVLGFSKYVCETFAVFKKMETCGFFFFVVILKLNLRVDFLRQMWSCCHRSLFWRKEYCDKNVFFINHDFNFLIVFNVFYLWI